MIVSGLMSKANSEMERLGLLAAIPGIELAIAALQEQLRQMKEDAGIVEISVPAKKRGVPKKKIPAPTSAAPNVAEVVIGTQARDRRSGDSRDIKDPDWRSKLSKTLKAKWEAMTPRQRKAKSRALVEARRKQQALKKKTAA